MNHTSSPMERFFQSYQLNDSTGHMPAIAEHFADVFLAAGPQGAKSVRRSEFVPALLRRKELFDDLGCQSTALVSMEEAPLDARFILVKTKWQLTFDRKDKEHEPQRILVDSVFIVDTGTDDFKIIFYLANQDIMLVLKNHGILPA